MVLEKILIRLWGIANLNGYGKVFNRYLLPGTFVIEDNHSLAGLQCNEGEYLSAAGANAISLR
jgi:hypothetical protein